MNLDWGKVMVTAVITFVMVGLVLVITLVVKREALDTMAERDSRMNACHALAALSRNHSDTMRTLEVCGAWGVPTPFRVITDVAPYQQHDVNTPVRPTR